LSLPQRLEKRAILGQPPSVSREISMFENENELLTEVDAAIRRYKMLESGETVVVGVSGGPDSVALLYCLVNLYSTWPVNLVVAHLNHRLRGKTADQEAAFVKALASSLNICCEIGSEDVRSYSSRHGLSIQEGARKIRYIFYDKVAVKYGAQKIALGHQADDNAESILMHLLRGTGPKGLSGIPPVREGRIIRPFIDISKGQILQFLEQHDLKYVQDSSNLDSKYLRNRIRHELLPVLVDSFNPKAVTVLTRLASIMREEEDFWDQQVKEVFPHIELERTTKRIVFSIPALNRLHRALLRRSIRHAVALLKGDMKRLEHKHVEAVIQLIGQHGGSGWLDLPQGVGVFRDRDEILFFLGVPSKVAQFEYHIAEAGITSIPELGTSLKLSICRAREVIDELKTYPSTVGIFDLEAVFFPLIVRNLRPGDRFTPLGMSGSQKVKDFFINCKISRSKRWQSPVLLSHGKIIWLGGHRIDNSVKVTEETKRVLKAELRPV